LPLHLRFPVEREVQARRGPSDPPTSALVPKKRMTLDNTSNPNDMAADLHAEMEAAMKQAMNAPAPAAPKASPRASIRGPRVVEAGRERRTGRVISVGPSDVFLEFGPKELGIVARIQFKDDANLPEVGSQLEVFIDKFEAAESLFVCSLPGAVQKASWELLEAGQTVEAKVTGVVKGGLELEVAGHRAFMPGSQVAVERIPDLNVFMGEKFTCEVVRVERAGSGNIVLSRRNVLERERKDNAEKLKGQLKEGDTLEGTVRKIMPFGAFVDLGGLDGLIHISDLTYERVGYGEKAIEKILKEGQKVTVRILKIDWDNNRLSLGMKQLSGDPFQTATQSITEGADLTGRVKRVAEFGAFVEIAPGVEGLVHISELDHKRVQRTEDAVKVDEIVQVRVLKVDRESRRVSLSIKALKAMPEVSMGGGGGGGGARKGPAMKTPEEIKKETPAFRRLKAKGQQISTFRGGLG